MQQCRNTIKTPENVEMEWHKPRGISVSKAIKHLSCDNDLAGGSYILMLVSTYYSLRSKGPISQFLLRWGTILLQDYSKHYSPCLILVPYKKKTLSPSTMLSGWCQEGAFSCKNPAKTVTDVCSAGSGLASSCGTIPSILAWNRDVK